MINKPLDEFNEIKNKYYQINSSDQTQEEKSLISNQYIEELKLFLFEANKLIKDIFGYSPSPYFKQEGYNAFFEKSSDNIGIKSKDQYFTDLNNLTMTDVYLKLENQKKALIDNALEILKDYYKNSLK